jgi:Icc-related predicted phosphoesterase/uncharacterized protein YprB with RNaseH-like and TPR domain
MITSARPKLATIKRRPDSLRLLAFSDCRVQQIASIVEWVQKQPTYDLIIYAGDDISRFVPGPDTNHLAQLASLSKFGLVAVTGNDDRAEARQLIRGRKVYEIHSRPLVIGRFLFIGLEGAPILEQGVNPGYILYREEDISTHLAHRTSFLRNRIAIVVSHTPPRGCLDEAMRWNKGQIGSTALRSFVLANPSVVLVVCGHAHLCGGRTDELGNTLVLNVASHDDNGQPARLASIHISKSGKIQHTWHKLKSNLELSSIPGIGPYFARKFVAGGISSVAQLASAKPEQVANLIGWNPAKTHIFISRAKANLLEKPIFSSIPDLPSCPRIYLDIETDLQHTYCWLVGMISDEEPSVKQFFAPHPSAESKMLQEMLLYLKSVELSSMLHFSGSDFDKRILIQRLREHGLRVPEIINKSTDCHAKLFYSMAIPGREFSLKNVATQLGYNFTFPNLDGFQVALDYQRAIRQKSEVPEYLLRYNQDDVLALRFVVRRVIELLTSITKGRDLPPNTVEYNQLSGCAKE